MRFNFLSRNSAPTVNHEGAAAFTLTPEVELYAAVATAALGDKFYEVADTRMALSVFDLPPKYLTQRVQELRAMLLNNTRFGSGRGWERGQRMASAVLDRN